MTHIKLKSLVGLENKKIQQRMLTSIYVNLCNPNFAFLLILAEYVYQLKLPKFVF